MHSKPQENRWQAELGSPTMTMVYRCLVLRAAVTKEAAKPSGCKMGATGIDTLISLSSVILNCAHWFLLKTPTRASLFNGDVSHSRIPMSLHLPSMTISPTSVL